MRDFHDLIPNMFPVQNIFHVDSKSDSVSKLFEICHGIFVLNKILQLTHTKTRKHKIYLVAYLHQILDMCTAKRLQLKLQQKLNYIIFF